MRGPGTPTLDQLAVLTAVADEGGLAAAARRQKRATSAISYAIDTLEAQLGLKLFDRVTTRRPRLTPEGAAVLADARALLARMDELKARVRDLSEGLEAEVARMIRELRLNPNQEKEDRIGLEISLLPEEERR